MNYDILHLGSTYRFEDADQLRFDGTVLDLTGATVTVIFRRPAGTTFERAATVASAGLARVYYDSLTADLDVTGVWARTWRVRQGTVDVTLTPWVNFRVVDVNAA